MEYEREPIAKVRLAAFISYRRSPSDLHWARWLHRRLETYVLPRGFVLPLDVDPSLVRSGNRLSRTSLDEAEFSATNDLPERIRRTLEASSSLIVVCSPRAKQASWIQSEIEEFRRLGRGDRIFALLIEGEPRQSFPEILFQRSPTGTDPLLTRQPLAADVREARWWRLGSQSESLTKLVAAILGVDFDALWQRERRRLRSRRRFLALSGSSVVAALVGLGRLGYDERRRARRMADESAHRLAAEAIQEVSALWREDSHRAMEILRDTERIPEDLRGFAWSYFYRLCRPMRLAWSADDGSIHALAYLLNGSLLTSGAASGRVALWDTATGNKVRQIVTHNGAVRALAASADNRWIASGGDDGRIQIWDMERQALCPKIEGLEPITALAFGPGRLVFSGNDHGLVQGWDPESGQLKHEVQTPAPVHSLVVSDAGRLVGIGELCSLWEWAPDERQVQLVGKDEQAEQMRTMALVQGSVGTLVATAGGISQILRPFENHDYQIRCWSLGDSILRKGLLGRFLSGHDDAVRSIAPLDSPGSYEVASVGDDGALQIWNVASHESRMRLTAERTLLQSVACFSSGGKIATGDYQGSVRIWDIRDREPCLKRGSLGRVGLESLAMNRRLKLFATGDDIGRLRFWSAEDFREIAELAAHGPTRGALAFALDGRLLAAGTKEGGVQIWDAETRTLVRTLRAKSDALVHASAFSPDQSILATATSSGVLLYDLATGSHRRLDPGPDVASDLSFTSDGEMLAVACGHSVRFWAVDTGRPRGEIVVPESVSIEALALRPVGRDLAAACSDGSVRVWNLGVDNPAWTAFGHRKAARTIAYTPDGRTLASGGYDDLVVLWDPEYGAISAVLECDTATVADLEFSSEGRTLVVVGGGDFGGSEQTIHAWTTRW